MKAIQHVKKYLAGDEYFLAILLYFDAHIKLLRYTFIIYFAESENSEQKFQLKSDSIISNVHFVYPWFQCSILYLPAIDHLRCSVIAFWSRANMLVIAFSLPSIVIYVKEKLPWIS